MAAIRVEIVSAEIAIFSGEASMVVAPGKGGDLGIAPKHTPLLTTLRPGEIELHKEGSEKEIKVLTQKATGKKCPICWKISVEGCQRPNCEIRK